MAPTSCDWLIRRGLGGLRSDKRGVDALASMHPTTKTAADNRSASAINPKATNPVSTWLVVRMIMLALAVSLGGCAGLSESWRTPEVELVGIQPKEISFTRQLFVVTLAVGNPNERALPIQAMTYSLALEGQEVAQGASRLERLIPAHGEETVEVEVVGDLLDLVSRLPMLTHMNRPLEWMLSGSLTLSGGLVRLPYRYSGKLDARQWINGQNQGRGHRAHP